MTRNMTCDQSPKDRILPDGDGHQVAASAKTRNKIGTLFIEARLNDGLLERGIMDFGRCEAVSIFQSAMRSLY